MIMTKHFAPSPAQKAPVLQHKAAKERIECWPKVKHREMSWYKFKAGELRPSAVKREFSRVRPKRPIAGDRSDLHTHTWPRRLHELHGMSLPSKKDLEISLMFAVITGVRRSHIASLDWDGKVMGYYSYAVTGKFLADQENRETVLNYSIDRFREAGKRPFLEFLAENGFIRSRITAMPGYLFDHELGMFLPKL